MVLPLLAVFAALTLPHGAHVEGHWNLGRGYRALVFKQVPPTEVGPVRRTFEIRRDGRVLRRWRAADESMPVRIRDITGDGIGDVLVVDYIGGSSACETYRLYGGPRLRWLWRLKSVCEDSTRVQLRRHGIDTWTAIDSSHYTSSIHCCWRRWRHSSWRWQSGLLRLVRRTITTHPPAWIDPQPHG